MGVDLRVYANTSLSTEEIFEILCKDMDVKIDETHPEKIVGNDFSCLVFHIEPVRIISDYLAKPLNLHFEYRLWDIDGYVSFMRLLLNWLKYTDADTVFTYQGEYILLSRIDGRLIRNTHPIAEIPSEVLAVIDIPYDEADLGFEQAEDEVGLLTSQDAPQMTATFCRHIFDNCEVKIDEAADRTSVSFDNDSISIFAMRKDPIENSLKYAPKYQWRFARNRHKYPFLPNCSLTVNYRKGRGLPLKRNGAYFVPARDDTLKGVAGLIKTTDCSLVLAFSDPTRDVLMYHAGELTLYEDSCWTPERLALFEGIPYQFSAPTP